MGLRRYPIGRWLPFIGYGVRDGPPPRNRPGRAAVFGPAPPQSTKNGEQERQTICEPKKIMLILYLTCLLSII